MIQDITIRCASHVDIPAIAKMQISSWEADVHKQPIEYPLKKFFLCELKKRWQTRLEKNIQILLLEVKSVLMGFIAFYANHNNDNKNRNPEIVSVYVAPELRRQGLGRLLCDKMLQQINNSENISVWILDDDQISKSFYEKLGFNATLETQVDRLTNGTILKEIRFQKNLNK